MNSTNERRHIFTVNVEDYYQVGAFRHFIQQDHWERFETRLRINTEATLELLAETQNHATFFTSGWIAENHPELLRDIIAQGHEIACQGYHQQSISDLPPKAFSEDIKRSKASVEDAIGVAVNGFRIGRGWVGPSDLWVLEALGEAGFLYDSSLCPMGRQFSDEEYRLRLHRQNFGESSIWEIPVSATRILGWSVPFSGGNYVRQFPKWPVREAAARWVERRAAPLVMYFHIWEIDADQPNISAANWLQKTRHYRNLERMAERMKYFLTRYPFTSVQSYLGFAQSELVQSRPAVPAIVTSIDQPKEIDTTANRAELTVVVPCYNEEASLSYLSETLTKLKDESATRFSLSFVFVNDGSTDATENILQSLFGQNPDSKIIAHTENRGIGQAIITGFSQAETEFVAVIDADCTFDPLQLPDMFQLMDSDIAAVAASPFHQRGHVANVPEWRLLLSRGAAFLYRLVLNHQFSGYTSCFRIYRTDAIKGMTVANPGFCGVTEILARLDIAGHKLVECPAELHIRLLGQSKINLFRTTVDHLKLIVRIGAARWLGIPLPSGNKHTL